VTVWNSHYSLNGRLYPPLPPHPGGDMLLFFAHSIGIDRRGGELRMPHPFLDHMQGHPVHGGVNPEPVAQAFWAAMRCIWNTRLDHHPLDDLPDPNPAQIPDGRGSLLAGALGFPDAMGGGQSVEELGGHRNSPEHDLGAARGIAALLEGPDRDGPTG
jgi:hypothetical protein